MLPSTLTTSFFPRGHEWQFAALHKPVKKCGALSAVQTPDETVWGFRASDIYQGGETEPLMLTETVLAADNSLDIEFVKSYSQVVARNVRAHVKKQTHP